MALAPVSLSAAFITLRNLVRHCVMPNVNAVYAPRHPAVTAAKGSPHVTAWGEGGRE